MYLKWHPIPLSPQDSNFKELVISLKKDQSSASIKTILMSDLILDDGNIIFLKLGTLLTKGLEIQK